MNRPQTRLAVVHLVRAANGIEPFRRFLASYRAHDAGEAHRLVLLAKGFARDEELAEHRRLLDGVPHEVVRVPDRGYDVGPYMEAARTLAFDYFCFLNSFSQVRVDGWLGMLFAHASRPGVGVVGATGSYTSHRSRAEQMVGRPGPYDGVLEGPPPPPAYSDVVSTLALRRLRQEMAARRAIRPFRTYPPFPAPHLRTNAFVISRAVAAGVRCGPIRAKEDAYRFESGKDGLTHQVLGRGLKALVVGADGEGYDVDAWPESEVFWQGRQGNLLVADNQTVQYDTADAAQRTFLSRLAWGTRARPTV